MITSTVIEVSRHASIRWEWSSVQVSPAYWRTYAVWVHGLLPFSCLLAHRFDEENKIHKQQYFACTVKKSFLFATADENSLANAANSLCDSPITAIARQILSFCCLAWVCDFVCGRVLLAVMARFRILNTNSEHTHTRNFPAHGNIQMTIYCQLRLIGSAGDVAQHLIVLQSSIGNNSL